MIWDLEMISSYNWPKRPSDDDVTIKRFLPGIFVIPLTRLSPTSFRDELIKTRVSGLDG